VSLQPGTVVGNYEISGLLGAGGMGEVYRARDLRLKREVALKVLPEAWAQHPDRTMRFAREAELLAAINHANIAAIYGVEEASGLRALVLELVDGPTLADVISDGPMKLPAVLSTARQLVEALDTAHEHGIVHRDLKPANIKVRPDSTVKVLDFGLAKALEDETPIDPSASPTMTSPAMTRAGVILGTAAYMSPEQARGQVVDRRADIWAFGCVLFEMLSGRAAFGAATISDTVVAILDREPDWSLLPVSTPLALRSLIARCLQKDRRNRLRDIGDARIELDAPPEDTVGRLKGRSFQGTRVGVAVGIVAVAIGTLYVIQRGRSTAPDSARAAVSSPLVLTPATADDGITADPALSNDGALLAYASDRGGNDNLDLWVQQTAGSIPLQLTKDALDEHEPTFSPDGSRLAYRWERDAGGIYTIPALGGQEPRLLVAGGRRPRYSPDGRYIAYWMGSRVGFYEAAGAYRTFVVPAAGGTAREITGFTGARFPVWSPDSQSLLLLGTRASRPAPATYDWWRVPIDGGEPVPLNAGPLLQAVGVPFGNGDVAPEDWRGDRVLFSADRFLWSVRLDASGTVLAQPQRLTFGTNRDVQAASAASGVIAFASLALRNSVWALSIDANRGVASGEPRRITSGVSIDGRPSASRDGALVVYRRREPRPSMLIAKLTSKQVTDVGLTGSTFGPALSPDGATIAYEDGDGVGVVPTRGGAPRTLCRPCQIGDWFADSRSLVAVRSETQGDRLMLVSLDNGASRDLIVSPGQTVNRPFPSPDGHFLAFRRTTRLGEAVLIAPIGSTQPAPESSWKEIGAPENDTRPCGWSPDGNLLYFVSARDGMRCLYAQRVNRVTGAPEAEPFIVRHFHAGRNVYGSGTNVLSTGPANAIAGGFFWYDLSDISSNVWTMRQP
jgi:serine/threonine protein kinase/Tol biopolymer transport system component